MLAEVPHESGSQSVWSDRDSNLGTQPLASFDPGADSYSLGTTVCKRG